METLTFVAGLGIGLAAGSFAQFLMGTKPLIVKLANMRYDGFRPSDPVPPRPKTVPLVMPRED